METSKRPQERGRNRKALTPRRLTTDAKLGETRGPIGEAKQSASARDQELGGRLWDVSEELTGVRYAFA